MPPAPDLPSTPTRPSQHPTCFQRTTKRTAHGTHHSTHHDAARLVHHTDRTTTSITGDHLFSLCGGKFAIADVEATSQPGTPPAPGEANPGPPCVACRIALLHRRERHRDPRDKYLTWLLLQGQWLLSDAQLALDRATLTEPEHHTIITVLTELSRVLLDRARREFRDTGE